MVVKIVINRSHVNSTKNDRFQVTPSVCFCFYCYCWRHHGAGGSVLLTLSEGFIFRHFSATLLWLQKKQMCKVKYWQWCFYVQSKILEGFLIPFTCCNITFWCVHPLISASLKLRSEAAGAKSLAQQLLAVYPLVLASVLTERAAIYGLVAWVSFLLQCG